MPLTPRPYQQEAIDAAISYLYNSTGNGIIQVPTAGGKSLIQAEISRKVLEVAPQYKIICVTHITKLLSQNHDELKEQWPEADAGIYSATYKSKKHDSSIVFAGIQSVYQKAHILGPVSLVLIDECQAVPTKGEGMYIQFLEELKKLNPHVRVLALSASPWKINGPLVGEGIFDEIIYQIPMRKLLDDGFLCQLTTPKTSTHIDSSKIKVSNTGEFNERSLQELMDDNYLTQAAIDDAMSHGRNRRSWLVFCSGVDHAKHVVEELNHRGISSDYITGSTKQSTRENLTEDFKAHKLKALVSVGTLTTGFNAKNADLLIVLRATKSSSLWLQILGRGMRTHSEKNDCMVLDYGENIERFGPIEDIEAPPKKYSGGKGVAPVKSCFSCEALIPTQSQQCPKCGVEFEMVTAPNHNTTASTASILKEMKEPIWCNVKSITARNYLSRKSGKRSLRVNYHCGIMTHSEWWPVEGNTTRRGEFSKWWMRASGGNIAPDTIDEAAERVGELKVNRVLIDENGKYPRIVDYDTAL